MANFNKNDKRYNQDGFFNFRGWLKLLKIDYKKHIHILIITAVRNMGKSVGMWNFVEEFWQENNYTKKIAVCRNNDIRMKESINSFKAAFNGKYEVVGGFIYTGEIDEKTGKIKPETKKDIGRFVNIENQHNYKSGADGGFKGYHLIFWDEFNEDVQTSINFYERFVNLTSTIERYNKPFFFVVIGNKVNANNDIFTYLNLKTKRKSYNEDFVQIVSPNITYLDIGFDTYKHLNINRVSLTNTLANFHPDTKRFFNEGGFLAGTQYNVVNALNFLNSSVKYVFSLGSYLAEFGTFENEELDPNTQLFFIRKIGTFGQYLNEDANIIALNVEGYSNEGATVEKSDLQDIADMLFLKIQQRKLYYDSFELMNVFQPWIFRYTTLFTN